MSATLRIVFLQPRRESVEVHAGDAVSLGRAPDAKVRLEAAQVSSRHATIAGHEGRWMLIDQGSRNGTLLNGTLVAAQAPCELRQGDEVTIHPFRFRVDLGAPGGASTLARSRPTNVPVRCARSRTPRSSRWRVAAFGC